mgnify:FL=1
MMDFKKEDLIEDTLFATPFWHGNLDHIDNIGLEQWILNIREKDNGTTKSNYGGWQSPFISNLQERGEDITVFLDLIHTIREGMNLLKFKNIPTDSIMTMWANINNKGNWNQMHHHIDGFGTNLSGIYYVKCPENCGQFVYKDPRSVMSLDSFVRNWNMGGLHTRTPKAGDFYMFPPYLEHMVTPSQTEESRISIAWNVKFEGDEEGGVYNAS